MTRRIVFWVVMISVTAGLALNTSLRVQAQEERLEKIRHTIEKEEERIRVLVAEWHMLKSPARLEGLVERHLDGFGRISSEQMISLADLPEMIEDSVQVAEAPTSSVPSPAPTPVRAPAVADVSSGEQVASSRPVAQTSSSSADRGGQRVAAAAVAPVPATASRASVSTPSTRSTRSTGSSSSSSSEQRDAVAGLIAREALASPASPGSSGTGAFVRQGDAVRDLIERETRETSLGVILASAARGGQ